MGSLCALIVATVPESETGLAAAKVIEAIPAREAKIKASPTYRTEAALQTCREVQSWIRAQKRAGNISNLQSGLNGYQGDRLREAVEYLSRRMDDMQSMDSKYRLGRRIQSACGG